nr:antibiotic ABC transporter ATP-binding protein [Staphylococcus lugdunensis]
NGKFVQDVDMTKGSIDDATIIKVKVEQFDEAKEVLENHFNVLESHAELGELHIKIQQDYSQLLKLLAQRHVYPTFIESRKNSLRDTYFNINQRGDK